MSLQGEKGHQRAENEKSMRNEKNNRTHQEIEREHSVRHRTGYPTMLRASKEELEKGNKLVKW